MSDNLLCFAYHTYANVDIAVMKVHIVFMLSVRF